MDPASHCLTSSSRLFLNTFRSSPSLLPSIFPVVIPVGHVPDRAFASLQGKKENQLLGRMRWCRALLTFFSSSRGWFHCPFPPPLFPPPHAPPLLNPQPASLSNFLLTEGNLRILALFPPFFPEKVSPFQFPFRSELTYLITPKSSAAFISARYVSPASV